MPETEEGARSFVRFFEELANGQAQMDASEALHQLVNELHDEALRTVSSVAGDLTLKIKVKVQATGAVGLAYELKTKTPTKKTPTGFMWVTAGGNLTATNPRQTNLPLREVGASNGEARDVGEARGSAREV